MYSSLLDLQENYLLVDYQTCCPYKNVQFLSFAHILFVNKFRLLTQVREVIKNHPIFSVPVHFDINSDENLFLVIDITKNRYFNIDSIINLKNTILQKYFCEFKYHH